jgi:hypothetical protein
MVAGCGRWEHDSEAPSARRSIWTSHLALGECLPVGVADAVLMLTFAGGEAGIRLAKRCASGFGRWTGHSSAHANEQKPSRTVARCLRMMRDTVGGSKSFTKRKRRCPSMN